MKSEPEVGKGLRGRAAYFFTRFPVASETFLQREVKAMRQLGAKNDIYSLWGGEQSFDGRGIRRIGHGEALSLLWRLPAWIVRRPGVYTELLGEMLNQPPPSPLNVGENLWGICAGTLLAGECTKQNYTRVHAVWASMPAMAAWLVRRLVGVPYSLGAHAYDLFEDGGDWLLELKLRDAYLVHTTTEQAQRRILTAGAAPGKVRLIRRGLDHLPPMREPRRMRSPLRLLSVGRLVEKKGYFEQLEIYRALKDAGVAFEAKIIGEGPLRRRLEENARTFGLGREVRFAGVCDYDGVLAALAWADLFLFTGKVAANGNRDGFPNVVGEAMAAGAPVICSNTGGLPEVVMSGVNGILVENHDPEKWVREIVRLQEDDQLYSKLAGNARSWAEKNFDALKNASSLLEAQEACLPGCIEAANGCLARLEKTP